MEVAEHEEYMLSCDIGISNFAWSLVAVNRSKLMAHAKKLGQLSPTEFCQTILTGNYLRIEMSEHVNLNHFMHRQVLEHECQLFHGPLIVDKVAHWLQEFRPLISSYGITTTLVEAQPYTGVTNVETLIHQEFRHTLEIIQPQAVHRWLGTSKLCTYFRKAKITELTEQALTPFIAQGDRDSQHQQDTLIFVLFHLHNQIQT